MSCARIVYADTRATKSCLVPTIEPRSDEKEGLYESPWYIRLIRTSYNGVVINKEYVYSAVVYQKYLTRLRELIILEPWIFLIYDSTMYVFYLSFNVWFVEFRYF